MAHSPTGYRAYRKGRTRSVMPLRGSLPAATPSVLLCPEGENEQDLYRQKWRPGTLSPFTPSAPFGKHPGIVRVRAQWMAETIDIDIMNTAPRAIMPDSLKGGRRTRSIQKQNPSAQ